MDCIFCKIITGDIPSKKVFENEYVYAFDDIAPQAPVHTLVIPKKHIINVNDLKPEDSIYAAQMFYEMFYAVKEIAAIKGISESGYRLIINNEKGAGQEVFHIHIHIIGGKYPIGPMVMPAR